MNVNQINSHVADSISRLLEQYKSRTGINGFYAAFGDQTQDLENAIFPMSAGTQIWDGTQTPAFGAQLDAIGTLVGIARNGLTDSEYLLFIFGKIGENYSDATLTTIGSIIANLFQGSAVLIQPYYPAGIAFQVIGSPIPESLYHLAQTLVENSLGAGIKLVFGAASPYTNVFRFAGPGVVGSVNGFADLSIPGSGGLFVELIN